MVAEVSVVSNAEPEFHAAIQFEDADVVDDNLEVQLVQRTLATIFPPTMPLPESNATVILLSYFGSTSPVPFRGESVTFPAPSVYMTKMVLPDIWEPIPRAAHW